MEMLNVTEQRLVNQKNGILKTKWLPDLELEESQRNTEDIGHGEVRLKSDKDEGWFGSWDFIMKDSMCLRKNVKLC